MTFMDWFFESFERIKNGPIQGSKESVYELYLGVIRRIGSVYSSYFHRGTPIYERDWDALIILDGCRRDLLKEVENKYSFLRDPDRFRSMGSTSDEWMRKNFIEKYADEMSDTIVVTGNPFFRAYDDHFFFVDHAWKECWDNRIGTIHPDILTKRAVHIHRKFPEKRIIIHYMQPHYPFVGQSVGDGIDVGKFGEESEKDTPWSLLREGRVDRKSVWEGYRSNLQYVLASIKKLLNNMDTPKTIITSDHGNALGEFGFYGHPEGVPINALVEVPWYETDAEDFTTIQPEIEITFKMAESSKETVRNRLSDLGYL